MKIKIAVGIVLGAFSVWGWLTWIPGQQPVVGAVITQRDAGTTALGCDVCDTNGLCYDPSICAAALTP